MLELCVLALAVVLDPLSLRWDAPAPTCASAVEVEARLRARLGARADQGRVEVEGSIVEQHDGLRLRLRIVADAQVTERELSAPACAELVDATVLIASLAIEGRSELAPSQTPSETPRPEVPRPEIPAPPQPPAPEEPSQPAIAPVAVEPPTDPAPAPITTEPVPAPPTPARRSRRPLVREGAVRVGAGAAGGQLPGVGAAILAGASMGGRRWLARVDVAYAPPRRAVVPGFDDRGVLVQAWYVSLDGGLRWSLGERVRVPATLGLDVGALHGRGFGVQDVDRRAQPWLTPALDAGLEVTLARRVALWLGGRLGVPLLRPAFAIEGRGTAFRADRVAWRVAAGALVTFGGRSR